ncbi:MAG: hypothetical protein Q8P18_32175 [Pseudomonadota bacterium]|nr:hypothetical protein [Pseudomonadota bacterium]
MWVLAGCGPTIIAYPPPSMLPGAIEPLGGGEVDLGVGASALVWGSAAAHGAFFNELGGPLSFGGGVGLGHGVDVSIVASQHLQGPTGGLSAGLWLLDQPMLQAGPIIGIAGSLAEDTSVFTLPVVGPDGPILTEDGEPLTTGIERDYAYTTIAPSVGGRLVWRPADQWSVPVMLRGSYSVSIARKGLEDWDMPRTAWIEGLAGIGWSPSDHFTLALGTGVLAPVGADAPFTPSVVVNASAHIRFDTAPDP